MSTDRQEDSPERQIAAYHAYCTRYDLLPSGTFEDLGVSATHTHAADRHGLQALLAGARRREFDVVFVEELSRAARRAEEWFPLAGELRRLGIAFCTKHDDPTREVSAASRFAQGVIALAAELEAGLMGERVRDTLRLKVSRGEYRGGAVSLGYQWDAATGTWTVNEEQAEIARYIYRTYLQTSNLEATAAAVNAAGHLTTRGNGWTGSTIRKLLRASMYRGRLSYNGEEYPADLPEVIPPALLQAVDERLANLRHRPLRADQSAHGEFTGLLRCHVCGEWLSLHQARKGTGPVYYAYYCWRGRVQGPACTNRKYIGQGPLDRAILPHLQEHLNALAEYLPAPTKQVTDAHRTAQTLRRLDDERARIIQLYTSGRVGITEMDKLLEGVVQKREVVAAAQPVAEKPTYTAAEIRRRCRDLPHYWERWQIPDKRRFLQEFIEHCTPQAQQLPGEIVWRHSVDLV